MTVTDWVVSCADGLESLLMEELAELGVHDCTRASGAVLVRATQAQAYRICLWSRLASRVFKPLLEVDGITPEALYEAAAAFSWSQVFPHHKTFAIHAVAARGVVTHTQYMALKLKDAIADHFRTHHGSRPDVRVQEPDVALHVYIREDGLTINLDLSGESLHRRGYRTQIGEAPLKETLASAILRQAGWPHGNVEALLDPMCGSGTFLTEAALMFGDVAPGLHRNYYGFLGWAQHDAGLWRDLLEEARQREAAGRAKVWPRIVGYDADRDALQAALRNAHAAGLSDRITLEHRELWKMPAAPAPRGLLVTNPPYGERIGDSETTLWLYRALGRLARERLPGWQAAVLAADITHADALGLQHRDTQRLRNGDLTVFVRHGEVLPAAEEVVHTFTPQLADIPPEGEAFANRLQKNLAHSQKQARQEGVSCYRVYDADLPDFNLAIDIYGDCLHVQEYAAPKEIDPEKAAARFRLALTVIRQVFGLHKEKVFIKVRTQQKGNQQYEKQSDRGKLQDVREGRAHLLVNLTDYLDTGLFLDHRPMRLKIAGEMQGKTLLNLFAYTGSVSVHAALGGARQTVTVDLSGNYLDWARKNFAVNGISPAQHRFEEADVLPWLRRNRETFDVIFIDPPTFSNSKKMRDVFDVQRDHVELLTLAMRHLKADGTCYFSNNFRRFELDEDALQSYAVEEISPETIGFDFKRDERIHRCWRLKHTEASQASIHTPEDDMRHSRHHHAHDSRDDRSPSRDSSGSPSRFRREETRPQRNSGDGPRYRPDGEGRAEGNRPTRREGEFRRDDRQRPGGSDGRRPYREQGEGERMFRDERSRYPRGEGQGDQARSRDGDRPFRPRHEGERDGNRPPRDAAFRSGERTRPEGGGRTEGYRPPRRDGDFRREEQPRSERREGQRPFRDHGGPGRTDREDRVRTPRGEGQGDTPRFRDGDRPFRPRQDGGREGGRAPREGGFRSGEGFRQGGESRYEGQRPPRREGGERRDDRPRFARDETRGPRREDSGWRGEQPRGNRDGDLRGRGEGVTRERFGREERPRAQGAGGPDNRSRFQDAERPRRPRYDEGRPEGGNRFPGAGDRRQDGGADSRRPREGQGRGPRRGRDDS